MTQPPHTSRAARNLAAVAVATIAAIASYDHQRHLAARFGQSELIADLMPLSVDGLLIVAAVEMQADKAAGVKPRTSARLAFVTGVVASIAANILATPGGVTARVISAWPAVALLLVVEVLSRRGKATAATPEPAVESVPEPATQSATVAPAKTAEPAPERAARWRSAGKPSAKQSGKGGTDTATAIAKLRERYPDATQEELAKRSGKSLRTVQRYDTRPATPPVVEPATVPVPVQPINGHEVPALTATR